MNALFRVVCNLLQIPLEYSHVENLPSLSSLGAQIPMREVFLINCLCSKGNKENKCITTCGRTCVLLIKTGALRTGQAIHVWILRKSKWLM